VDHETEPVAGPELLVSLERGAGTPLHEQLEGGLREQIRTGRLGSGARLPSSRALAAALRVSRGVVLEAYGQLTAEGYLTAHQGAATRVASVPSTELPPVPAAALDVRHRFDLRPGVPDLSAFPRQSWARSLRAAVRAARFADLGAGDPRGAPELRNELMGYLARVRGAIAEPEHTLICSGFTQAFAMLCRTLAERGVERIALEDPGWPAHRLIAERGGLEPVPVAVDEHGLDVAALDAAGCEVVVVTPAHQFPTGVVLGSERRAELIEWAEERDALIVEDDYDSELRYDRVAVGALQGLAPERVCHIGSVSKRIAPGLRLGWVLSPSWLTGALTYERGVGDGGAPAFEQLALAEFIARGELDRHLRRMRLRYRTRRESLLAALHRTLPDARATGIGAGLHLLLALEPGTDEQAAVGAAARLGVGVEGLDGCRAGAAGGPPGLVIGYGNLADGAIERAVGLLGEAVRTLRRTGARPPRRGD
jgi:GntR family transcriptional regulator/MocR family aminotransferase